MRIRITLSLLAICLALPCVVLAQTRKPAGKPVSSTSWKLIAIKVTGSTHYSNEEVIGASGLQIGEMVTEDNFKRATEKLGETGAFSGVQYNYQYSSEGAKLELQLADNDQLVAARFDNIVWYSDEELQTKLRDRVPMFQGQLPLNGNLADLVSDALQALLIEKQIQGRADYLRSGAANGPIEAYVFSVSAHTIRIRNIEFTGVDPALLAPLQGSAKSLEGRDYTRSMVRDNEQQAFLPVYLQRGYLKAAFADAQPKVLSTTPQETTVDVTVAVTPGLQYKLRQTSWAGNKAFPSEQLQSLLHGKTGQPADAVQMKEDLRRVSKLYGTRGYMVANIEPRATLDDAQSVVDYTMEVHEGDIYKMGELEIRGVETREISRLTLNWRLREGEVYDSGYLDRYLQENMKDLPSETKWKVTPHVAVNESDKTVDVSLLFESYGE